MFDGLKKVLGKVFSSAGYSATGAALASDVDYGPGISAYTSGHYGYSAGGDGSGWMYGLTTGAAPELDHSALRQNARVAYHDSSPARAIVDRYADIIPGLGLKFESMPKASLLGITPEKAESWGEKVSEAFDTYMASKTFSLTEDETGYQSQRLVSIMQWRDGEYFARLNYSRDPKLLNPLQVSFLDPAQIQGDTTTFTDGTPYVGCGIDYDAAGREIAYNVMVFDSRKSQYKVVKVPRYGRRSKRLMMLHGWRKEYPGQTRGYSRLAHALQSLDSFASFEHAHIRKAVNDAAVTMYVKPSLERPAANPLEDYAASVVGPYEAPNDPITPTDATGSVNYSEMNTVNLRPDSVGVFNLQGGEDLKEYKGSTPADGYAEFTHAFIKSLAASMSMPVEVLWMQFGQNYSASRASLVLLWQVVEIWRAEMVSDYLQPIFEAWLSGEIAAGRVKAPGWTDPRMRQAWLAGDWIGFPMPIIDPLKNAKASESYAAMGATTLDRIAREHNGTSGKANRAKLARELKELPQSPFMKNPQQPEGNESREGMKKEDAPSDDNYKRQPGRPPGS